VVGQYITYSIQKYIAKTVFADNIEKSIYYQILELKEYISSFSIENGSEPNDAEIMNYFGWSKLIVRRRKMGIIQLSKKKIRLLSLDAPSAKSEMTLYDRTADPSETDPAAITAHSLLSEKVTELLGYLHEDEKTVITLRFGLDERGPHKLEEIGEILGCTRQNIWAKEQKALKKIRELVTNQTKGRNNGLKAYYDE
jgi:DNA-directed RNA polymerase sigma subunit (sigma70/sigma32)